MTISLVNRHLHDAKNISFTLQDDWKLAKADILTAADIHDRNSFESPEVICDQPFAIPSWPQMELPPHSIIRLCLTK